MNITIKAMLINMPEQHKNVLDNIMIIFCTAIRFSFNRLLEGMKLGELEKQVACKYHLIIRQAKEAVENARQTIQSQKELVKLKIVVCEKRQA